MAEYILYEDEKTILIHPCKCLEYLKKKANEGDDNASFIYGKMVFEGDNVPFLPETGILYMLRAAMNGHEVANEEITKIENAGFKFASCGDGGKMQFTTIEPGVKWEDLRQTLEIVEQKNNHLKILKNNNDEIIRRMGCIDELPPDEKENLIQDARLLWG